MMNEKLDMTQKLGDAFLGQQKEVMDAIQTLRAKADQAGNLEVEQGADGHQRAGGRQTVIKIEPANPQVVYVPTYNPTVVYGPWPYPAYPPYYYYPPATRRARRFWRFAAGVAVGARCGAAATGAAATSTSITTPTTTSTGPTSSSNGDWKHNAEHRKGVQYRDQAQPAEVRRRPAAGVDSREQFRGRAEQGRQDICRGGADDSSGWRAPAVGSECRRAGPRSGRLRAVGDPAAAPEAACAQRPAEADRGGDAARRAGARSTASAAAARRRAAAAVAARAAARAGSSAGGGAGLAAAAAVARGWWRRRAPVVAAGAAAVAVARARRRTAAR